MAKAFSVASWNVEHFGDPNTTDSQRVDGRVRGVLLWNTWGQVDAARALIAEAGPFSDGDPQGTVAGVRHATRRPVTSLTLRILQRLARETRKAPPHPTVAEFVSRGGASASEFHPARHDACRQTSASALTPKPLAQLSRHHAERHVCSEGNHGFAQEPART